MIQGTNNVERKSEDTSENLRERSVIIFGVPEPEDESGKERLASDFYPSVPMLTQC